MWGKRVQYIAGLAAEGIAGDLPRTRGRNRLCRTVFSIAFGRFVQVL